jgi:hypothetical protein
LQPHWKRGRSVQCRIVFPWRCRQLVWNAAIYRRFGDPATGRTRQLAAPFEGTNDCAHGICEHSGGKPPCAAAVRVIKAAMNRRTPQRPSGAYSTCQNKKLCSLRRPARKIRTDPAARGLSAHPLNAAFRKPRLRPGRPRSQRVQQLDNLSREAPPAPGCSEE